MKTKVKDNESLSRCAKPWAYDVNLVYIRDILGHSSVQTTEIYARVDSKQKREVLEKAYAEVVKHETPTWSNNDNLLAWLKNFN